MRPLLALVLVMAGCESGVPQTPGVQAWLRSQSGRYVEGAFPAALPLPTDDAGLPMPADDAGLPPPSIATVQAISTTVHPGFHGKQISALASSNARTVAVILEATGSSGELVADRGYSIVPVGGPSLETPGYLDVGFLLDFADDVPLGAARLLFAAQDDLGRFGPAVALDLSVQGVLPVTDLVVALDWTADMDLDLFVEQPDGTIVSSRGSIAADGTTIAPDAGVASVALDSNANCVIDGARLEYATWDAAPSGRYRVFVRPTASCGFPTTGWRVRVLRGSDTVAVAGGAAYASQVDAPGGGLTGMGQLALTFAAGD